MRRIQRIVLASSLSALCAGQAVAQSGPLDALSVRPAVMLLVDTSGSMERVPDDGTNPSCENCVPTCTGDTALDTPNKTRWAMTVEALTGTIQNYTCVAEDRSTYARDQYDYGYYLPHINFTQNLTQSSDGILDSFAHRVKFGLMTFDGVGTTLGGETLVPLRTWGDSNFLTLANGAPGMYSYGRVGRLSFPGCLDDYGVNAGARGPGSHPGALVRVGKSDAKIDVIAVNDQIQRSLLQVRPFGGTPIAAMLDDLKYYLDGSDSDSDLSRTGDTLFACRTRKAILITDGAPDALFRDARFQCDSTTATNCAVNSVDTTSTKTCECPYDPAELLASQLIDSNSKLLNQLIVVAYNVFDKAALETLNGIGKNGTTEPLVGATPDYPYLVQANGPTELRDRLDDLLVSSQPGISTRSVPLSVNTGDDVLGANSKRFDIMAGFRTGYEDEPWGGLLFRRRVTCGGSTGTEVIENNEFDVNQGDIFHESLNQRTPASRRLFTAIPRTLSLANGSLVNNDYRPDVAARVQSTDSAYDSTPPLPLTLDVRNHLKPDGTSFSTNDEVPADSTVTTSQGASTSDIVPEVAFDNAFNAQYFSDADGDGTPGTTNDRDLIVKYVRGVSRPGNTLGDIYHSNPVALTPITSNSTNAFSMVSTSYTQWLRALVSTSSGAHYGADGRPGIIFVGTNDGILHAFNLDTWRDGASATHPGGEELWGFIPPALFGKMASMLGGHQFMFDGTPEVKDVVLQKKPNSAPIFRTILVSSVRGAPAFVALDVTHPEEPTFLWQKSFPDVGDTVANVAVTQVQLNVNGEIQQRAIAILPGGQGSQASSCPTGGHPTITGETRPLFPAGNNRNVRCWNRRGRALYVVDVATGQLLQEFGAEHFPSPLTSSVVVDGTGVDLSTAAYFFDQDGILWRLSMLSTDPGRWRVVPIYDMFASPMRASDGSPSWKVGRYPTYPPTLTRDKQGNLVIVAGTGDPDAPIDTARHRVISLTELRNADRGNGEIDAEMVLNWQIDLLKNESVTGPMTEFDRKIYFATFESEVSATQCALGKSRIYGVHAYLPEGSATPPAPKPELIATTAAPDDPPVISEEFARGESNMILGLTVRRQPICQTSLRVNNPVTGQSVPAVPPGGGLYQLSAGLSGSSTGGIRKSAGSQLLELPNQTPLTPPTHTTVTSWASFAE